ncbi:MAG TPA: hypothetical protein VHE79_00630 [Spirochaetia bacterium]
MVTLAEALVWLAIAAALIGTFAAGYTLGLTHGFERRAREKDGGRTC